MTPDALPRGTRLVHDALAAAGFADAAAGIRLVPDGARTAAEAAAALGVEVGAIANSLIFVADDAPLLVMTSGAHRVHEKCLAGRIGSGAILRATPEIVRDATGQPIGGVSPVGHPAPVRTLVDAALEQYPELWAAAGTPHAVFPTTFADLVAMTGGEVVEVD